MFVRVRPGRSTGHSLNRTPAFLILAVPVPTFIPTTGRTAPNLDGPLRNIVAAQRTFTDVHEHSFGIYDLFEGTEQIQQLVISRAISGVHIR